MVTNVNASCVSSRGVYIGIYRFVISRRRRADFQVTHIEQQVFWVLPYIITPGTRTWRNELVVYTYILDIRILLRKKRGDLRAQC